MTPSLPSAARRPRRSIPTPRTGRRPGRPSWRLAAVLGFVGAVAAPLAGPSPAGANGLTWKVAWSAPITSAGPNSFDRAPQLAGTASPPVAGDPASVAYTVALPGGYPSACAVPPGAATLKGQSFTVAPAFACNGSYSVSVVARSGGLLPTSSKALTAPVALADPGPATAGVSGVADSTHRVVTVSWTADPAPDVVGYRVRRDGVAVADVATGTRVHSDTVSGPGTYRYDVQTLRWGAGGPGSAPLASPPSAPLTARIAADAPPTAIGPPGTPGTPGSPGTGSTGRGTGGTGTLPGAPSASPTLPKAGGSSGRAGSRTTYRSGGTIATRSSSAGTAEEADTYQERLPYQAKDTGRSVELTQPDTTRTVARSVTIPGSTKPGLLVPMAVVLVLVAGSLQIRSLLGRAAPATIAVEAGSGPTDATDATDV